MNRFHTVKIEVRKVKKIQVCKERYMELKKKIMNEYCI